MQLAPEVPVFLCGESTEQGYTNPSDMFKELLSICKERERKTNTRIKGFLEHDKEERKGDRDE